MKIAFIIPSLANKGPILVVKDITDYLSKIIPLVKVFYFDEIEEVKFTCPTQKIKFWNKIDFNDFDIIHTHMFRPDLYMWYNRKFFNGKCITTLHNYMRSDLAYEYNWAISLVFSRVWKYILRHHDWIVTLSKSMEIYYQDFLFNEKFEVIYNGRKIDNFNLSISDEDRLLINQFTKNRITLGICALLTKRKGIDQVVKALEDKPNWCLIIIGDGKEKKKLEELAKGLKVESRCLFLGYKDKAYRYLPFFDIYLMPSRSEGFPLALIEAAIYKKPSVCSDIDIFTEAFTSDEVAFFKLENIESLKKAISHINEDKVSFSQQIYFKYISCYTSEEMASNYLRLYNKLIPIHLTRCELP